MHQRPLNRQPKRWEMRAKDSNFVLLKKALAIFIAVLYLAVSSGLVLEIHHCMGEIADISLVPSGKDKCGNCGMSKQANACCKDEVKLVKLQDAYKLSAAVYKLEAPEMLIHTDHLLENRRPESRVARSSYKNHSPPNYPAESLVILNCVFRI